MGDVFTTYKNYGTERFKEAMASTDRFEKATVRTDHNTFYWGNIDVHVSIIRGGTASFWTPHHGAKYLNTLPYWSSLVVEMFCDYGSLRNVVVLSYQAIQFLHNFFIFVLL